jgi:hypothetical protein
MIRKLVVGALAVALFTLNSSAQFYPENARIKALGGSFIVDDPSYILRYSAYINQYTDDAQINFNAGDNTAGGTFNAPIWGVKSFGQVFNLGILANRSLLLDNPGGTNFYTASTTALKTVDTDISGFSTSQNIPHVLLGFNLSEQVRLGVDLFWENSHFKKNIDRNPAVGDDIVTDVNGNVNNFGFIASENFGSKEFPISVKYGMSFPRISAKSEVTTTTGGASTSVVAEEKSKGGLYLTGGAELGFTTANLNWKTGADYIFDHFAFKDVDANLTSNNAFFNNLAVYIGFNANIDSNSFVTLLYDFQFRNTGDGPEDPDIDAPRTSHNRISNIISAGYENTWTSAWVFDKFIARAGLNYWIYSDVDHVKGDGTDGKLSSRIKHETVYNQIDPRVGLGIVKKAFCLDVTVHPTAWAGLISGPAVGEVSATLIF